MARFLKDTRRHLILTLDISSKSVGYALYDFDTKRLWVSGFIDSHFGDYRRIGDIASRFSGFMADYPHDAFYEVIIEQPFFRPGQSIDLPIKMMHGAMFYAMYRHVHANGFSWNFVTAATWRSGVVKPPEVRYDDKGKRRKATTKEKNEYRDYAKLAVINAMQKCWNASVTNDDHGDALGMMRWRLERG